MTRARILLPVTLVFLTITLVPELALAQIPSAAGDIEQAAEAASTPAEVLPLAAYYQGNPMVEVARSTIYGAIAGTVLGLAAALVIEDGDEVVKWGFVLGTFGGFFWGLSYASKSSSAALDLRLDKPARVSLPIPMLLRAPDRSLEVRVPLLHLSLQKRR